MTVRELIIQLQALIDIDVDRREYTVAAAWIGNTIATVKIFDDFEEILLEADIHSYE